VLLLSVFPPLRISVCKLLVSGSLHLAIYLKQPGEAKDLRVREGEWVGKKERRAGRKKVKACRDAGKERVKKKSRSGIQIKSRSGIQSPHPYHRPGGTRALGTRLLESERESGTYRMKRRGREKVRGKRDVWSK